MCAFEFIEFWKPRALISASFGAWDAPTMVFSCFVCRVGTWVGVFYVASFDGNYLLLCVFSEDTNADPLMKATLVPCLGEDGANARKTLLGWLIEAREETRRGNNRGLGKGPAIKKQPARPKAVSTA